MPESVMRIEPLDVVFALLLGTALTLSSWIVWQGVICGDALLCGFPTLGRGFPLPWIREFATPNIPPYHGTIERLVNFENLAFDLAAWSWLSFVALLLSSKETRQGAEELFSSRLRFLGFSVGAVTILVGFIVALFVVPPQQREFSLPELYPLSILGYSVAIVGVGTLTASYRRSGAAAWWSSTSLGTLITLATSYVLRNLIQTGSSSSFPGGSVIFYAGEYGFPVGWIVVDQSASPLFRYTLTGWAFIMDVLIWGSVAAAVLVLVSLRNAKSH